MRVEMAKIFIVAINVCIVLSVLVPTSFADNLSSSLVIESSPVVGGTVVPQADVDEQGASHAMTLTAVPNDGYRFMFWLGDVADSSAMSTTVLADSPQNGDRRLR